MVDPAIQQAIQAAIADIRLDLIGPEIIVATTGILALVVERLVGKDRQHWVAYASALGVFLALLYLPSIAPAVGSAGTTAFAGLLIVDGFSIFFKYLFLAATLLVILMSVRYLEEESSHHGEYYSILCFATLGMMFMASANDLVTVFVSLELMALSIYVLVGFLKKNPRSNEAAMKYFILGAFSTAFFVYGISLFYGVTGSTSLEVIGRTIGEQSGNTFTTLALIMLSVGLAFKVAAVPFHAWAPDAYQGAPTPITAYISVASKSAAFAILLRILLVGLYDLRDSWVLLLMVLSVASMTVGNVVAIVQDNVKRMLAYSSIAHAGYVLIGVVAAGSAVPGHLAENMTVQQQFAWTADLQELAQGGALLYLFAYTFMNIGAFGIVAYLRRRDIIGDDIQDFAGLAKRSPAAAMAMTVFLLSLGGIPPTAGFIGKLVLFGAAVKAELYTLAVIAVLNTAVSIYFYFRIVVQMWMKEPRTEVEYAYSTEWLSAVAIALIGTLLIGVWPQPFLRFAQHSILEIVNTIATISQLQ